MDRSPVAYTGLQVPGRLSLVTVILSVLPRVHECCPQTDIVLTSHNYTQVYTTLLHYFTITHSSVTNHLAPQSAHMSHCNLLR